MRLAIFFPPHFRLRAQTTQPGVSRSASAGFPLCLLPAPILSGKWRKVACLPQKALGTFPRALRPFQVPARSFPNAGGNLQISPTGLCSDKTILFHIAAECAQQEM